MRPGTAALALAAALVVGFIAYDLLGFSRRITAQKDAAVADQAVVAAPPSVAALNEHIRNEVESILATRGQTGTPVAAELTPALTGVPRADTPAEFAEVREKQYRELLEQRRAGGESPIQDLPVEEVLRMKSSGVVIQ